MKINLFLSGLYRVNYDERNWGLIISYLLNENFAEISPINRVQIIDDLLDLARSGEISYERALDATSYLNREKHFLPWKAALSNFDFISRMFRSTDGNRTLKVRHILVAFISYGLLVAKRTENVPNWFCPSYELDVNT